MAPPIETFSASELPLKIQTNVRGKRRKDQTELKDCELMEMVQYACELKLEKGQQPTKDTVVICQPVERLFRRCKDREGTFMVETTEWEHLDGGKKRDS